MAIPTAVRDRDLFMDAYGGIIGKGLGRMFAMGLAPYLAGQLVMASSDDDEKPYWFNENFLNAKHSDFMKITFGDT
ncbi:hypothetical protein NL365_27300, partial [Klebsiella pneumoniae]|nr:hypothetical protein [Klebsiella pneumoniae]